MRAFNVRYGNKNKAHAKVGFFIAVIYFAFYYLVRQSLNY